MSENLISYEQLKEKIDYLLEQGEKITFNNNTLSISAFSFSYEQIYFLRSYKAYLGDKPLVLKEKDIERIMIFLIDEYKKQQLKEYNEVTLKEFEKIGK